MSQLLRRGQTFYARLIVPLARRGDVGKAMGAAGGTKREIVRTLQTTDRREATRRRGAALAAMRADVDIALRKAGMRPLTDWTASWGDRAAELRQALANGGETVSHYEEVEANGETVPMPVYDADLTRDTIADAAAEVEARQGLTAAREFIAAATTQGMSVTEGTRRWLEEIEGSIKAETVLARRVVITKKFGPFILDRLKRPSLEVVALSEVTRVIAMFVDQMQPLRTPIRQPF